MTPYITPPHGIMIRAPEDRIDTPAGLSTACKTAERFEGTGAYRVIEPPRLPEYTRRYTGGVPIPEETITRYELDDLNGRTRLRVVHSGFQSVEGRDEHGEHWVHVLGWLNSFIGKPDYENPIRPSVETEMPLRAD
jgi:hypothetical protein